MYTIKLPSLPSPPHFHAAHVVMQAPGEVSENASLTEGIRPEALDERQIEDLIAEHLQQHLEILPEQDLANALHNFVDKVSCGCTTL